MLGDAICHQLLFRPHLFLSALHSQLSVLAVQAA
jgi:hypothetical protein